MKMLILDGYTLFQEDIAWSSLNNFGELIFLERIDRIDITSCDPDTEVLITNKALVGIPEINHFKKLKLVIVSATGYNCVDVKACSESGIPVCNVPAYGTFSVAQHALSMMLHYSNQVALHEASVRIGDWSSNKDWSYTVSPICEWQGKTMGIIGMGNIGSCFAGMVASLGMNVVYHHTRDLQLPDRSFIDLDTLAATSDVISLHCPLNDKTAKIINERFLAMMKPNALLINTSRGGLIDTPSLQKALEEKQIAAAFLDVLEQEPPPANHPLIGLPNAIITPHIAWISLEARKRIFCTILEILEKYKVGALIHQVN